MPSGKKVFISHSHADREFAERFARALLSKGQDVWLDKWEIGPGDSIIKKIFEEGLSEAAAFVIVLSNASVQSKWVREELSVATVRRIEDLTRVIPILLEEVEIPTSLRTLHWVDMRTDFDDGIRSILNVLAGVSEKPPLGEVPPHLRGIVEPVAGLSRIASQVGLSLLRRSKVDEPFMSFIRGAELAEDLQLSPVEVNDAVDELKSQGLAETNKELGTKPFDFAFVRSTNLLFHAFSEYLDYSAADDVKVVLNALAALGRADGPELQKHSGLSPGRLNRAVDYLREQGYAEVIQGIGTAPYGFIYAKATRVTRQVSATL
jgi:DNA-binding MarR family transcriptional regulator